MHFRTTAPLAISLLLLGTACYPIEVRPCYGMERYENIGVRLVEVASPTGTYPLATPDGYLGPNWSSTCADLDGLGVGDSVVFADLQLANRIPPSESCSTPVGDAVLDGGVVVETLRDEAVADYPYTFAQNGAFQGGVRAVAPGATVADCTGTWMLGTYPLGIVHAHSEEYLESSVWLDEYTFDPLSPGTKPPVVIVRTFVVDEGTACPALGVAAGPFTCGDVFSGYYEPVP